MLRKLQLLMAFAIICAAKSYSQDALSLTERKDLTISQIENLANAIFKRVGTAKGSGYKQFQRWLYEAKFHTDANGYLIPGEMEMANYRLAKSSMRTTSNARLAGTWTEMGPKSWNRTTGWNPGVGQITSVAVNPSDTTIIYISSPGGGIWKSINSGSTWSPLMDNISSSWMNIFNIAIDPSNTNNIYAAITGGGVIKSTDGGTTWVATGSGPLSAKKVLVHPSNSSIIFATASNGIYRSTNGGISWTQVHNQSKEDIEFKPNDANIMYASGNGNSTSLISSVWRSADNGVSWTAIGTANGIDAYGRTLIGISPADPNIVYVVQASGSIFGKFYKSTDAGLNFVTTVTGSAASGTNYFGYNTDGTGTTGQATYDMGICVNPLNANEVHIAGIICFKSLNAGSSFTAETIWSYPNTTGYNHPDVHGLEWVKKTIYSGSDGGIYKSVDYGDNWIDLSPGLGIRQFYRIANSKTNGSLFMGGAQDNGTSIYKNTGWIDWLGADGMDCLISPLAETLTWRTSQNGTLYRTTNGGSSYSNLTQPSTGQWVTPLAIESNTNTIYGGWTGVYKSTDNGTTWAKLSGTSITTTLTCLAVAPSNPQYIYASNSTSLYVTTNGGTTWSTYTAAASITSIAVSQANPQKIWITCASTSNRVFVSTDAGATFTNISGNLPAITARSVAVDNDANETVYVGMNIGVYYIDNTTTSWTNISSNLPLVAINDIKIQKSSGTLRVATYGRGVWETALNGGAVSTCSTPTGVTASSIANNSATISWTAVTGASSYDLQYKTSSSSTWITLSGLTTTSQNLTGLTGSTIYNYQVRTNCTSGSSSFSATQNFTTAADACGVPTGVASSSVTNLSATISWTAVTGAVSYDLQYKTSAATTWTTVAGITATSQILSGLSAATIYNYQLRTNCSAGNSAYSAMQSFTTQATPCTIPTNISASSVTNNSATISWTAVSGAVSYDLQYKTSGATTWTTVAGITATSQNLTGLTASTSYNCQVKTNCSANGSAYSTSQSFTTLVDPCNTPTNVTASSITDVSASIMWTAVSGALSYDLQYKTSASTTWTTVATITTASYNLTGLSSSTPYDYQVKTNCSTNTSVYSANQSFSTLASPCGTPGNPNAGGITTSSATITWTGVSNATSYDLQYKPASSTTWTTISGIAATSYTLTGLAANTQHNYKVDAKCNAILSSATSTLSFTTLATTCAAPTNVKATGINNSNATISWDAISDAQNYYIKYKKQRDKTWITTATFATNTYLITGLASRTSYYVQVWVNCTSGAAYYTQISFKTGTFKASNKTTGSINELIDQNIASINLVLAPNPASNYIDVIIPDDNIQNTKLMVIDLYGRVLKVTSAFSSKTRIDITGLAVGIYQVKIISNGNVETKSFMKQ
ncbi:MAG: fibronectin type III domain-containing protein [Sphingobacteriales bacterium]